MSVSGEQWSRLRGLVGSVVRGRSPRARFEREMARRHGVAVKHESGRQVVGTTFGRRCRLRTPVYIGNSHIGDRSYVEAYSRVSNTRIGKFSAVGPACHIGLAEHPSATYVSTHPIFYRRDPGRDLDFVDDDRREELPRTEIGNDVWIGASVCVKAGVRIGDGAVIGAGAVVTADVPPYAVCAGVPARVLRYRFDEPTIDFLLAARWWDRDERWLREHREAFEDVTLLRRLLEPAGGSPTAPAEPPGTGS